MEGINMGKMKFLIAGLPESGKSTFIGALWTIVRKANPNLSVSLKAVENELPEQLEYLKKISQSWQKVEDIDRTAEDVPEDILIKLVTHDTNSEIILDFPDFKGESFRSIISKNQPQQLDEWCQKSDILLYFMSDLSIGSFYDDFEDYENDTKENQDKFKGGEHIKPSQMTPAAQNMLILRYLKEHYSFKKVIICLTQWDEYVKYDSQEANRESPEKILKQNAPVLYNFITYHYPNAQFCGISSQGAAYQYEKPDGKEKKPLVKKVTDACKKELKERYRQGKRAYICRDKQLSFDITLLFSKILG